MSDAPATTVPAPALTLAARWRSAVPLTMVIVAGTLAGVGSKMADESGLPSVGAIGSSLGPWILALALAGRFLDSARRAALFSAVFTGVMTVGYYAWATLALDFPLRVSAAAWLLLSITVVPLLAAALCYAYRRFTWWSPAVIGLSAAMPLIDHSVTKPILRVTGAYPAGLPLDWGTAAFSVVTAIVIAIVLPRTWPHRAWAAVATVPAYFVMQGFSDLGYSWLGSL